MKTTKRAWIIRIAAVLLLAAIAALMLWIGRGHTVYLDNKALDGYNAPYKITVTHKGEQVAKLYEKERGSLTNIGDNVELTLEVMAAKGGSETTQVITIKLPHNMDSMVINLPALMGGASQDVYLEEFVPVITETADDEVPDTSEDMGLGDI